MIIHGNGANMHQLKDQQADMVITSPPYFSDETEIELKKPIKQQKDIDRVERDVVNFALTLKPVFKEIRRVLKIGGACVVQTKDLRFGGFIIPLVDLHCDLLRQQGFRLVGRTAWLPTSVNPKLKPHFKTHDVKSGFKTLDTEIFLTLSTPEGFKGKKSTIDLEKDLELGDQIPIDEMSNPLWQTSRGRFKKNHPHAAPIPPIRRFIALFSNKNELVVDPFAGGATNLWAAKKMGRKYLGYEIDTNYVNEAKKLLEEI